jgi:dihydrofolate reductase
MITLIAATDRNNLIGNSGKLPWKCPEDMKFFKTMTSGNVVVMGRKTYESIGSPLKNRTNVVISRTKDWLSGMIEEHIIILPDLMKFFQEPSNASQNIFIIGGRSIYEQSLQNLIPERLLISRIDSEYVGDEYFPEIPKDYSLMQCFRISPEVLVYDYRKASV